MRNFQTLFLWIFASVSLVAAIPESSISTSTSIKQISGFDFRKQVFDFTQGDSIKYVSDKPSIVIFTAAWCSQCRKVDPVYEELAAKYKGKINCYYIDYDIEKEIVKYFGIYKLPTIMFFPTQDTPKLVIGYMAKDEFTENINQFLLK